MVSIQLGSPASGDMSFLSELSDETTEVSIQLGSPASGDSSGMGVSFQWGDRRVSIQLGSPASGDIISFIVWFNTLVSFHSIGIPSEWGRS